MKPLHDRVRRAIERDRLLPPGCQVLAAVSGGADSVALLLLLRQLAPECGFALAGIAHFNHQLRGSESDDDERFCRELADRIGVPVDVGSADVAALARAQHVSIEVAARRARYAWFSQLADRLGADHVATGHTRDDQAETFLLRVLRGAGSSGLAGIRPARGIFVRPLLDIRRKDLVQWLAEAGEGYRDDSTNADLTIPRNWIRHRLLPLLARHLNADITAVLARQALVLRDESTLIDQMAEQAYASVESPVDQRGIALDVERLRALPVAVARRVVRIALLRVNDSRFVGFDHVEQVLGLAAGGVSRAAADLPGVRMERNPSAVVLSRRESRDSDAPVSFNYGLPVPGRLVIPECGCVIETSEARADIPQMAHTKGITVSHVAVIDSEAAAGGLWVRSRIPGDRVRPLGLGGKKKLQDVMVDLKVPRTERDRVPVVVDSRDRIVWVAGYVAGDEARVTDCTQTVVILKLSRLGES
ncbi:MAG: tRNA lysidine(34) synthetase TilS [Acidobacteria bacterium]|nr:tRNA lysidine(34) synthetase TilS [Acidobacteriota bacterium]